MALTGPRPSPGNEIVSTASAPATAEARNPPSPPPASPPTFLQPGVAPPLSASSRLSGSAWLFLRRGGGSLLAPGGQLGGAQVGARLVWRLDQAGRFGVAARVSGPLRQPGFEAAAGIEWRPWPAVPLRFAAERRVALDRFGRNAFSIYGAGGLDDVALGRGVRLDAYAQAGVVGARARDLFADGALRIGETLAVSRGANLTIGAGAWGAAQPDVARLDLGPQAVLRWSVAGTGLALALDWRLRVAGRAHPDSGPTLTLGVDF